MDANGKDLVQFWTYVAEQGLMPSNTAGALRSACREVLTTVKNDEWEALDLREVDVDDFNERFSRLRAGKGKPETLRVYQARFKNGVNMYREYLESPSTWRYKAKKPYKGRARQADGTRPENNKSSVNPAVQAPEGKYELPPVRTIDHQYPLRPNLIIKVQLPVDLTESEATKLSAFVASLVREPIPAIPARASGQTTEG